MKEDDGSQQIRKSLADAGLVEIEPAEFPERIREIKQIAIGHLCELLEKDAGLREPRSVAHALGTLRRVESTLRPEGGQGEPSSPPSSAARVDE